MKISWICLLPLVYYIKYKRYNYKVQLISLLMFLCGIALARPNWESLNVPPLVDDNYKYNIK
jgi:putative effector of murein hydrolase